MYYVVLWMKLIPQAAYLCWSSCEGAKWNLGLTSNPHHVARFETHEEALVEANRFLRDHETPLTVTRLEVVRCNG